MAGKILDVDKNLRIGNKINSNMVKISSSKSILSYQNGSALDVENRECTTDEGMPADGYSEETSMSEEPLSEEQNLKSECLDILRKKLISNLSLAVFSSDLESKLNKMEPIEIGKERQSVIQKLIVQISQLSDAEKLLLYLKLPSSTSSPFDPLRQPLNPLGNRQEIQQTIVWIKTHLEEDSEISIPKQEVYDQYLKYCENVSMKPLSTADFGKVMKQVYPGVRPRRLGTRGNSRYCYSGMRNTCKLPTPILPQSSIENSSLNESTNDAPSLSVDRSKLKKLEKTKRKWKSPVCRNEKSMPNQGLEKEGVFNFKNSKRTKADDRVEETGHINESTFGNIKQEFDLGAIKCEESSDNSFNAFDLECGLSNDLEIYFKNSEKGYKNSEFRVKNFDGPPHEEKQINKKSSSTAKLTTEQQKNSDTSLFSSKDGSQMENSKSAPNKISGFNGSKRLTSDQAKPMKGRTRRSASFSKISKSYKKIYVPIQPKPVETPKLNLLFDRPIGVNSVLLERKSEAEGVTLCEESDSQEPEEEIVRYFKHLDENDMGANGLIDQAVKDLESSSVQISNMSQILSKNAGDYRGSEELLSQSNQQVSRSQSCSEVHKSMFNVGEAIESDFIPRSQSSVELPTLSEGNHQEVGKPESSSEGKRKKISHLRILLEKSVAKNSYLNGCEVSTNDVPVMSVAQMTSLNPTSTATNYLLSNVKPLERDLIKFNGLKIVGKGSSVVPESPNTRTKYFSFTPISPGPHSPLKTPSTPSVSPFVSPRDTPISRSKVNFNSDFFVSPSGRKSASLRIDSTKSDLYSDNVFNFSKSVTSLESNKPPTYLQGCRPRSFSSTNFCRTKARRNSAKLAGFYRPTNSPPKNRVQSLAETNFSANSQFSFCRNYTSSDSFSKEVGKFLENNSKMMENQSATIRSQSVPLNRMMGESSWITSQVSPVYSGYFNSTTFNPTLSPGPSKFDWIVNSDTNSSKNVTANVSSFVSSGEMNGLSSGSFSHEVFSGDSTIVNLNDQYFPENFPSSAEDGFPGESAFSNKLDLNSSGTFDSAFTGDSDPGIADSFKSFMPDFEGIDNKSLAEPSKTEVEVVARERKLFKNDLYETGSDNMKDPVITAFKPVLSNGRSSPVLNFFGAKINEDNQQLIEFFDFED